MNYREARVYLDEMAKYGSVLGLDSMRQMLTLLDNPQDDLKFVHLAGTNGKGSVLAYLSTVLKEAGYLVGRYISPTLFSYRERIQVNEEYIEKEALARLTSLAAKAAEEMTKSGFAHPTAFEMETALAFLYFKEKSCDIVILETGLGGLEDATNVIRTTVMAVITPISMDHMAFLGNTLTKIAENKAGIIKEGCQTVSVLQKPEAMAVIERACSNKNSPLTIADSNSAAMITYDMETQTFSYGGFSDLQIKLAGEHQIRNAVLAVTALKELEKSGYLVGESELRAGLLKTKWEGRFSVVSKAPVFIIDGAHNTDAAAVLKKSLEMYFTNRRIFYIMGIFKDKEYEEIVRITVPGAAHIMTVQTPGNNRALDADELTKVIRKYNPSVETVRNIDKAVNKSLEMAGKDDVIIAFGSLSFLGEITKAVDAARSAGR